MSLENSLYAMQGVFDDMDKDFTIWEYKEDIKKENIVTSTEATATERERGIRRFLAESLPPTEERIQEVQSK